MRRSIDQWRNTVPKAVVDGSPAQAMYCIADAKADIAQLFEENERAAIELRDMGDALEGLRKTAALLLQNAEGCAVNHYGDDYAVHGEPGWLADCRADIEKAQAALDRQESKATSPTPTSDGES